MKTVLLKIGNISSWGLIGLSYIYSTASLLYGILPADITQPVINTLSMNAEAIIPVGISSFITGSAMVGLKVASKFLAQKLNDSNLARQVWETKVLSGINSQLAVYDNLNDKVVAKQNAIIANQEMIKKQNNAIITFNTITAQRNIASELIPQEIKALYQEGLNTLKTLDFDVKPINTIFEKTVEVIKEVPTSKKSRVVV